MDAARYVLRRCASSALHFLRRRFTPAGWLALSALAASAVLGVDTNQSVAYQAFAFLLALLLLSLTSAPFFRPQLRLSRVLPRFGTAGQPLPYVIQVRNLGRAVLRGLRYQEEPSDPRPTLEEFRASGAPGDETLHWIDRAAGLTRWRRLIRSRQAWVAEEQDFPDLPPGAVCEISRQLLPLRRGRLTLTSGRMTRTDPLGLFKADKPLPAEQSVLVLPKRYPVPRLALPGRRRYQQGGVALSSSVGEAQEFRSLRDYRVGDPMRRIHWRSWSKTGKLIVKEHHDEYFVRHALVLDTFCRPASPSFEEAVSVAASFVCSVLTQESLLDLLFVGDKSYCFTAGRGLAGADRMLEVLACVQACPEKSFEELRRSLAVRQGSLSGCVCVLLAWDAPRRALVEQLRRLGVPALVTLVLGPDDPRPPASEAAGVRVLEAGKIAEGLAAL